MIFKNAKNMVLYQSSGGSQIMAQILDPNDSSMKIGEAIELKDIKQLAQCNHLACIDMSGIDDLAPDQLFALRKIHALGKLYISANAKLTPATVEPFFRAHPNIDIVMQNNTDKINVHWIANKVSGEIGKTSETKDSAPKAFRDVGAGKGYTKQSSWEKSSAPTAKPTKATTNLATEVNRTKSDDRWNEIAKSLKEKTNKFHEKHQSPTHQEVEQHAEELFRLYGKDILEATEKSTPATQEVCANAKEFLSQAWPDNDALYDALPFPSPCRDMAKKCSNKLGIQIFEFHEIPTITPQNANAEIAKYQI
jgi:hypothetical protein